MDVLVYADPSPRGEWALAAGRQLAARVGRSVVLLATEEDAAARPDLLPRFRQALAGAEGIEERQRPGPAERAVIAETSAHAYDLVIVPPAGRGAIARLLKGSRVASVVRQARAPVLVARRPPERIGRVLAALSGRASAGPVCRAAAAIAKDLGARLALVHVVSEIRLPGAPRPPTGGEDASGRPPHEAMQRLLAACEIAAELHLREGLVVEEILAEIENGAHELLVAGAEEPDEALGREPVGERLLLRCPVSMLVVPLATSSPPSSRA
ncbi:MAG: universal stress protein [Vicinamibacteria bacterium]